MNEQNEVASGIYALLGTLVFTYVSYINLHFILLMLFFFCV